MKGQFRFLGTGTSVGTPMILCKCKVCSSTNERNHRLRAGGYIEFENRRVLLLDASTDFRIQALKYKIERVDAVFLTHQHADHIFGLDDLRIYNYYQKSIIPVYCPRQSYEEVRRVYDYAFSAEGTKHAVPLMDLMPIGFDPIEFNGLQIIPIPVMHGDDRIFGYRIGSIAYITDVSEIPVESIRMLEGLDVLILSALRYEEHPKHLSVDQAVAFAKKIKAGRTYFTHISHRIDHQELVESLPEGIEPAYDGFTFEFEVKQQ